MKDDELAVAVAFLLLDRKRYEQNRRKIASGADPNNYPIGYVEMRYHEVTPEEFERISKLLPEGVFLDVKLIAPHTWRDQKGR
ncbi:MAG: hypothetical protein Q8O94_03065 [bacterium]|nr:hypothetical protein [bacterium]